jgi:type III restriction enzyme
VRHIIKQNSKTQEILLRIGDGPFSQVTEQQVRNIFPAQAYSQKQLSSIGVRIEELKRFVESPIKQSLDKIRFDIRDTEGSLKGAYSNLVRQQETEVEIRKYDLEISSQTEQATALRKTLKGLSDDDLGTIAKKALYDNEESIIDDLRSEMARAKESVEALRSDISSRVEQPENPLEVENGALIQSIRAKYSARFGEVREHIERTAALFEPESLAEILGEETRWNAVKADFEAKYETAKARATTNQQQLAQIEEVERRITEIRRLQASSRTALKDVADSASTYDGFRRKWNDLHAQKRNALEGQ